MYLIAGLGNPGGEYEHTRHNAGFDTVDALAEDMGVRYWKTEGGALTAKGTWRGEDVVLTVLGDGFLYNMVRIIAGTLAEVGAGRRAPGAMARALETGDRLELGYTAPACGLTLLAVLYGGDEAVALSYFA